MIAGLIGICDSDKGEGMKRNNFLLKLAGLLAIAPLVQAFPQSTTKTAVGPKVKVDGATSQPCYADSCANRGELSVTLPAGVRYIGTHYFTTADYPNDRSDVYETGPKEVSYARFSDAVHSPNSNGQEVVTVYYYNRANRPRWVSINVDYQ